MVHKQARFTEPDAEAGVQAGDVFTQEFFQQLFQEEYNTLLAASGHDAHAESKTTTLPIARALTETYVLATEKLPWSVDLLNINLNNMDIEAAEERIARFIATLKKDGRRTTENLKTAAGAWAG